jgi:hypothetical protein
MDIREEKVNKRPEDKKTPYQLSLHVGKHYPSIATTVTKSRQWPSAEPLQSPYTIQAIHQPHVESEG